MACRTMANLSMSEKPSALCFSKDCRLSSKDPHWRGSPLNLGMSILMGAIRGRWSYDGEVTDVVVEDVNVAAALSTASVNLFMALRSVCTLSLIAG